MHKLCEYVDDELMILEDKVAKGSKLSNTELEYADKLAHLKKSLLTNEAMERGYSKDYREPVHYETVHYGQKRDSMGRYSREDAREDMIHQLRELMRSAPDEHTRKKLERFINEL